MSFLDDIGHYPIPVSMRWLRIRPFDWQEKGLEQCKGLCPDVIIATGRRFLHWIRQDHVAHVRASECNFEDLAMDFMDIRKRVYVSRRWARVQCSLQSRLIIRVTGSEVTPLLQSSQMQIQVPSGRSLTMSFCRTWQSLTRIS